jgi:hypothetical protein
MREDHITDIVHSMIAKIREDGNDKCLSSSSTTDEHVRLALSQAINSLPRPLVGNFFEFSFNGKTFSIEQVRDFDMGIV